MGEIGVKIEHVQLWDVPNVWRDHRDLILSMLKKAPGYKETDLIDAILTGEMALWLGWLDEDSQGAPDVAFVLRLINWPTKSVLEVFLMGGKPGIDVHSVVTDDRFLARLLEEGQKFNADVVQAWMRPALAREAQRSGKWRKVSELMVIKGELES